MICWLRDWCRANAGERRDVAAKLAACAVLAKLDGDTETHAEFLRMQAQAVQTAERWERWAGKLGGWA